MDLEVIWEENSELIGNTIDDLDYWAGRIVMKKEDFMKATESVVQNNITAVFTRYEQDFEKMGCLPKENFKRIGFKKDLSNIKFSNVILNDDFYKNETVIEAHEELRRKQPELFKK